jgi:hypothetical protein
MELFGGQVTKFAYMVLFKNASGFTKAIFFSKWLSLGILGAMPQVLISQPFRLNLPGRILNS